MQLNDTALEAFENGVADGTIKDTAAEIVEILLAQDVVSYCSENGCYTFDYFDLEEI